MHTYTPIYTRVSYTFIGWASHSSSWMGLSADGKRNYTVAVTDMSLLVGISMENNIKYSRNSKNHSENHSNTSTTVTMSINNSNSGSGSSRISFESSSIWSYLPEFAGLNGPIFHLMSPGVVKRQLASGSGRDSGSGLNGGGRGLKQSTGTGTGFDSSVADFGLYIVGAFNDEPSVLYYQSGAVVSVGASTDQIQGLVTYIDLVSLWRPVYVDKHRGSSGNSLDSHDPNSNTNINTDTNGGMHWYSGIIINIVLLILAFGGLLSICMYVSTGSFTNLPTSFHVNKSGSSEGTYGGHGGFISLGALGGSKDSRVDLEACFQRAMKARHMPSHSSLCFINSDEILLEGIIGQGSFGRVWSGRYLNNDVAVKEFVFAQVSHEYIYI